LRRFNAGKLLIAPSCVKNQFFFWQILSSEISRPGGYHFPPHMQKLLFVAMLVGIMNVEWPAIAAQNTSKEPARPSLDLSGEWEFKMDPLDVGRTEKWFAEDVRYDRKIQVPGVWNTQGVAYESQALLRDYETKLLAEQKQLFGLGTLGKEAESAKLFSVYPGPGWYRKRLTIPSAWAGKVPWLVFHGIHREAEVWVNGRLLGAHHSYLTPLRIDLSGHAQAGETITISTRVDARRKKAVDPLMGCFDTLDFLYITWGGLYRTVTLEATEATRLDNVFVVPQLASETAEIRIALGGAKAAGLKIAVEILDAARKIVSATEAAVAGETEVVLAAHLAKAKLWTPKTPHLYTARIRLRSHGKVIDTQSVRFGMREFKVADGKFLLNGQPIFLRGYGDDCIFPNTISPSTDKRELYQRLSRAREYGFNYVRHHSWMPPEEYLDVADELGMMLQPEFPFAYRWDLPTTPEAQRSALEQWQAMIRLHRNHPSIVAWCMGNELYDSFSFAQEMYRLAKALDPTRVVVDSDGCNFKHKDRETLDFLVVQFGEGNSIGFQDNKYQFPAGVTKPVIAHEMGYFVTLPDLKQLEFFKQGLRPYWLIQARDLAERNGLKKDYAAWLASSYRLQAACLKSNMEAARRSRLNGTSVWLFQDYPNCAEGVVDMFFRPKGVSADQFRKFNSPTVLLLDVPRRNLRSGEPIDLKFQVSRFEDEPTTATLRWELKRGRKTVASGTRTDLRVNSGGVQDLPVIKLETPRLAQAERLTLTAELVDAHGKIDNAWDFWAFPTNRLRTGSHQVRHRGFDALQQLYPWALEHSANANPRDTDLLITSRMDDATRDFLDVGGRVILLQPNPTFTIEKTNFRLSSWDGGGPSGTQLDRAHPALREMPSEGWCDLQFYSLIQASTPVFLNPLPAKVRPLVRCIDRPTRLMDRAYLFEVGIGKGKLLVSGFNFSQATTGQDPGAEFFFDQLVRYALGPEFTPEASLPAAALAEKAGK
jgi:beta-galactosidase